MNQSKAPAAPHEPAGWILLVALLAATFVMRGPVTMAGPVAGAIREAFGASLSAYGLLAALPVAAFGAFSFAGPALAGRLGLGRAVLAALLILLAGAALRLVPNWTTLLFATLLVGAGIALLNVMMPVMVRSAWPGRVGSMVGLYTGVIGLSGAAGGLLSAPLLEFTGTLSGPFGLWAVLAVAAALLWGLAAGRGAGLAGGGAAAGASWRALLGDAQAWALTSVMGLQSLLIYTVAGWMPLLWQGRGMSPSETGVWIFVFLLSGLPASVLTARFVKAVGGEARAAAMLSIAYLAGLAGWLAGGALMLPASVLAGAAQGAMLSMAFLLMAAKAPDARRMLGASALAQGAGYLAAGCGPWIFGALRDLSDGWTLSCGFLALVIALWGLSGWIAARGRTLR